MEDDPSASGPPSRTRRWPGGDRAAALLVGVPLTAALVLAATPLSEPPASSGVSALPWTPAGVVASPIGAASPVGTPGRDVMLRRARPARSHSPVVVIAGRAELQAP
jgi:hypothetical protein